MARAPKCSVCGVAHWSSQPHQFATTTARDPKRVLVGAGEVVVKARVGPKAEPVPAEDPLAAYMAQVRASRAAYMRDYRARQKGEKR